MSQFFWKIVSKFGLGILSLRYRIQVVGLEKLKDLKTKEKGILFLPNHPAHMDPLILFLLLWPQYRMRPLVVEYIYRLPFLKRLMKLVRALPVPNFDTSVNQLKIRKAEESIGAIADGLKRGENFVLYPAGRLKGSGKEVLGGSSSAHALIQDCPEVECVLVRTTGLWGSRFSRALTGRSPDLSSTLWFGFKTLLKNGLFLTPRRLVRIDIDLAPKDFPKKGSRLELNRYLETWYNRYPNPKGADFDIEPASLVSYSFWRKNVPELFKPKKLDISSEVVSIRQETREKITEEIRHILEQPHLTITDEMNLALDLGMDSLDIAELIAYVTKHYTVDELHPEDVETVLSLLEIAEGARAIEHPSHQLSQVRWPKETSRPEPILPFGDTFSEAFLQACQHMKGALAVGDDLIGVLSYQKMKRSALVLSRYFQKMPQEKIAVLLPASVGAYLVILALHLAKKIPVMLNWTLGPRYLDEMMQTSQAKVAISSWRFLERLSHVEFGSLVDKLRLLEDIRSELSLVDKLMGLTLSWCSKNVIMNWLQLKDISPDAPAVILFTSGTESNPKGVPLSHKNILENQRAAIQCLKLNRTDVVYGALPPFHSFGFSVVGLFPIFSGIRIAFYPDPTDGFALAEGIERWEGTLFCSPPSFLKGLLAVARPDQLKTIRYFVTGAEKTPQDLYDKVANLKGPGKIIEGYGVTECSPILTITPTDRPPKGVGLPLSNIEMRTIHPETLQPLAPGQEGEVCVRGPNVFHGYLNQTKDPFIQIDETVWYRTGDIGFFDQDGTLILSGRLKRFTKMGGEMISLGAIEEALTKELLNQGKISTDAPSLALCADEKEAGKPQLILFTTFIFQKEEANEILKRQGFSRLVKISKVKKVNEIPLMGSGKTNYRQLQGLVGAE